MHEITEQARHGAVLDTAMAAGRILLQNGAEIFRVEDTMRRICRGYGAPEDGIVVIGNGIFTTGGCGEGGSFAKAEHIPLRGIQLDKVAAVNQLSRQIEAGEIPNVADAAARLADIAAMPPPRKGLQTLASALGAGSFCMLFGGGAAEIAVAFVAGLLLNLFILYVSGPYLGKLVGTICSGAVAAAVCVLGCALGLAQGLSPMISGAIIPLVPGVALTCGARDVCDGEYISGSVRLIDAVLGFFCVAAGVGAVIAVYHLLGGAAL